MLNVATQGNADMLGLTSKGRIEPGKDADMVIMSQSPLDGFDALTSPRMVVARGEIIDQPQVERFDEVDADLNALFDRLLKERAAS